MYNYAEGGGSAAHFLILIPACSNNNMLRFTIPFPSTILLQGGTTGTDGDAEKDLGPPENKKIKAITRPTTFLNLPQTDQCVSSVDTEYGMWVFCNVCSMRIAMRASRGHAMSTLGKTVGFTFEYWSAHKTCGRHKQQAALREESQRLDARIKSNDPTLKKKDRTGHKANKKNQVSVVFSKSCDFCRYIRLTSAFFFYTSTYLGKFGCILCA